MPALRASRAEKGEGMPLMLPLLLSLLPSLGLLGVVRSSAAEGKGMRLLLRLGVTAGTTAGDSCALPLATDAGRRG